MRGDIAIRSRFHYILVVIENFTKYVWVIPMERTDRDDTAAALAKTLKTIKERMDKSKYKPMSKIGEGKGKPTLQSDLGKEFKNTEVQKVVVLLLCAPLCPCPACWPCLC